MKNMRNKKGNEILQTLVIIAVLGAVAVTICIAISSRLKSTSNTSLQNVGTGINSGVTKFSVGTGSGSATVADDGQITTH